ncbi:uncharacterized protein [Palaemon carinicauda]|uniref:uncharacterized protein n=1 Tax=Palaemon carinicauda TaxID=392227 RepID=UPI0035B629C2
MMASLISHQFVVVLLSVFCGSVSGLVIGLPKSLDPDIRGENSSSTGTRTFQRDVILVLSSLIGQRHRYLQLLFAVQFKDEVHEVTQFSKEKSGIIVYEFDGSVNQLEDILRPVEDPTVLLLLCSPQQIVDTFRVIRQRRLNSHVVLWVAMLRDETEGDYVSNGLEGLVFEGTRVALVVRNPGRRRSSYSLFTTRSGVDGTVRFSYDDKVDLSTARGRERFAQVILRDDSASYRNMEGREMRIAAVNNFGLCNLVRLPDGTTQPNTGIDVAMMRTLSYAFNFTIRIVDPPDGAYGNPLPNGTVTGMIGLVARREADFAICAISLSALRKTVVDFPYPYYRSPLGIFSRAPKQKSRVFAILSPFNVQVWVCIIASVLVIGPIVALMSKVPSTGGHPVLAFQMFSFNMFRSIVVQGNRLQATSLSQRFVLVTWYMFCLIVSAMYSGMLTASLAIPAFEAPIDYLTDLPRAVKQGFDIGVYKDTTNELLFREAKDGIYAQTWKLFNHKNPERSFVLGNAFAMDQVFTRDFVYIGFMASCEILSTRLGRSKIHIGKETFFSSDIGMATPPGAPYTKTFGDVTLRLIEAGLRSKWKADELSRLASSVPKEKEQVDTYAITISHLQVTMITHMMGLVFLALQIDSLALNPLEILQLGPSPLRSLHDQFTNHSSEKDQDEHVGISQGPETSTREEVIVTTPSIVISSFHKQGAGDSVLGSLFELGVSDIEEAGPPPERKESPSNELLNEILELPFLPLTKNNGALSHEGKGDHSKSPLLQYLDMIRGDAWAQFKSLALSYSNWLEDEYKTQDITDKLPIDLFKKILDLGDRVNFLHVVGKKVDSGLAGFLADEMKPLFDHFETFNPGRAFGSSLSTVINNIMRDTAWKTMHQFIGHVLGVAERFVSRKDIEDFRADLAISSPLVAKGLDIIMNGPPAEAAEGRSLIARKGYHDSDYGHKDNYGHKDHYVHKDHYGHEDIGYGYGAYGSFDEAYGVYNQGYSSGVFLDPYLILGGLGAAALLAYLAYKVIVTTAGERRRRSDDLTFMELSDMPNLVYSFYSLLEGADEKYGGVEEFPLDDTEDLVSALNSLWYEREEEVGCVRCTLYNYVRDHFSLGHNAANSLLVAGIAHALGADGSGQLLDEVGSVLAEGQQPKDCLRQGNTCHIELRR